MKKKLLIILIGAIYSYCYAQKVTLSGTVKDSLQNPMPYANVIAKPKDVSKKYSYSARKKRVAFWKKFKKTTMVL